MIMERDIPAPVARLKALKEAELRRVAAIVKRDHAERRSNDAAKIKRPDESHQAYRARKAAMELTERGIGESLLTPEAGQHADYEDASIVGVKGETVVTKRNTMSSSIQRMFDAGQLEQEQYDAACEIGQVVEIIARGAAIRGGGLEPRVDCAGGAGDMLIEKMYLVRLEATYTKWREQLPMPRQLYIEMVITTRELVATARIHNVPWKQARKRLIAALDRWTEFKERAFRDIDEDSVQAVYFKLYGGVPAGILNQLTENI